MRRTRDALAVALLLSLAGCGGGSDASPVSTSAAPTAPATSPAATTPQADAAGKAIAKQLAGRKFRATEAEGRTVVGERGLEIEFSEASLSAYAGCNHIVGGYYGIAGGRFDWTGDVSVTSMACVPGAVMEQEDWFQRFLGDQPKITLEGGELLTLAGSGVTAKFWALPRPEDTPKLVGTDWVLTSISSGGTASSLPAGLQPPTLRIAGSGEVALFTGCNRGRGIAADRGDTVEFGQISTTRRACGPPADTIERQVLGVIDGEVEVVITGKQLTLTKGREALVWTAR
ncbi:MAG: META domain-containing protein [Solirubrobacteraceae bacterium]|nr:META domain-containing protein [Solirubrobacteraceae bacterium]